MTDAAIPAATAARAVAGVLLRHVVTAAGAALVSKGYLDQQTADSATGPVADYVLGVGLAAGAAGWGILRARLMHTRWVEAWIAPAKPLPPNA